MSAVVDLYHGIVKILVSLLKGEKILLGGISGMIAKCPDAAAFYVQISFIMLIFMGYMLYKRKQQRMVPAEPQQMIISQPPAAVCPPDYTLQKTSFITIGAVLLVLLACASFL